MSPKLPTTISQGFLSVELAAQWANVSPRTIRRWIEAGLPKYQAGPRSKVLIRSCDIEEFLSKKQCHPPDLDLVVAYMLESLKSATREQKG